MLITSSFHIGCRIWPHIVILESICSTIPIIISFSRLTDGTPRWFSNLLSSYLTLFVTLILDKYSEINFFLFLSSFGKIFLCLTSLLISSLLNNFSIAEKISATNKFLILASIPLNVLIFFKTKQIIQLSFPNFYSNFFAS